LRIYARSSMNRPAEDLGVTPEGDVESAEGSSHREPGWVVVCLIVAVLVMVALPRSITSPGLSWVALIAGVTVLFFWRATSS
jgi:hypothetical protein